MKTPQHVLDKNKLYRVRNAEAIKYHKSNARLRRFGLEPEDLTRMLEEQEYKCRICGSGPLLRNGLQALSANLDHCHQCGEVRSLLCKRCNTMVGFIESREDLFFKAFDYYVDHFGSESHPKITNEERKNGRGSTAAESAKRTEPARRNNRS
jgi:hypothetical protein